MRQVQMWSRPAVWASSSWAASSRALSDKVRPYQDIPVPKEISWPFIGHGHLLIKKPDGIRTFWKQILLLKDKYVVPEEVGMLRLHLPMLNKKGQGRVVLLFNPEDISEVHKHEGQYPSRGLQVLDALKMLRFRFPELFHETQGLLLSEGKRWHQLRSRVQQEMMRPQSAFFFLDKLQVTAQQLVDHIRRNRTAQGLIPNDFLPLAHLFAMESITLITLNTRLGALEDERTPEVEAYIEANNYFNNNLHHFVTSGQLWRFLPLRWSPLYRQIEDQGQVLFRFIRDKVDLHRREILQTQQTAGSEDEHQMSLLEKLVRNNGPHSTIPMVTAFDSLFAGVDTTGSTLSFLLYHLAINPEKQERLRDEVLSFGHPDLTVQDVGRMKYFRACLQESFRLLPTVFSIGRKLDHDIELRGFHIPAGTIFMWTGAVLGKEEHLFPQPDLFLPERWLDPHTKIHPFAVRQFGHGPRMCIGKRFAELELHLAVAKLLQNFHIGWAADYRVETASRLINVPNKPLLLTFTDLCEK